MMMVSEQSAVNTKNNNKKKLIGLESLWKRPFSRSNTTFVRKKSSSASQTTGMEREWVNALLEKKIAPLEEERGKLMDGSHADLVAAQGECRRQYEEEMERMRIVDQEERRRIERVHKTQMDALEREYEQRLTELTDAMFHELEERKRQLDADISQLDIGRTDGGFSQIHYFQQSAPTGSSSSSAGGGYGQQQPQQQWAQPGKKQLRRRPNESAAHSGSGSGGMSASTTDSGTLEKKGRKRSPGISLGGFVHLLSGQAIAEDLTLFNGPNEHLHQNCGAGPSGMDGLDSRADHHGYGTRSDRNADEDHQQQQMGGPRPKKVVLEQGKLVCDGKTFHRSQHVFVQSANYGAVTIPAIILQITDQYVQFRSSIAGDTRDVTATKEDLESGRVTVRKRY